MKPTIRILNPLLVLSVATLFASARAADSTSAPSRSSGTASSAGCATCAAPSQPVAPQPAVVHSGAELAKGPAFYQKGASWQETVRVSRDALAKQLAETKAKHDQAAASADPAIARFEPWLRVQCLATPPDTILPTFVEKVKIRVDGLKCIYLGNHVSLANWNGRAASWNDLFLVGKDGKKTPLTSIEPQWKLKSEGKPINPESNSINLPTNEVCFALDGSQEWLEGRVQIHVDGREEAWISARPMFDEIQAAAAARAAIWKQAEADDATEEDRKQITGEARASIWLADWTPGEVTDLAGRYAGACTTKLAAQAKALAAKAKTPEDLAEVRKIYEGDVRCTRMLARLKPINPEAMRLAIEDLAKSFPDKYPKGADLLRRAGTYATRLPEIRERLDRGDESAFKAAEEVMAFQQEALLANPLVAFDNLLLVRRKGEDNLGLSTNFGPDLNPGNDTEIAVLPPIANKGKLSALFRDKSGKGVCDVNLNYDADKMLFTMTDSKGDPQVWEIKADGSGLRQVSPSEETDEPIRTKCSVQNCNGIYLPDNRILFVSTATMAGVPCLGGNTPVGNLYRMDADGKNMAQLTFDQDQNWYPTVLSSGRVMYLRWEYTDTPHYFTRLIFSMNPDGTGQMARNKSNSYWPNSTFFARPIPNHPSQFVGVVTGHHGTQRAGELVLFDTAKGRREADGAMQRIPGYGKKVEPIIKDKLVDESWPKFLYPCPLADAEGRGAGKYFLVSCKLAPEAPWGIYVADIYDNLVPVLVEPGYALMEPMPLVKRPRPPVVPDRIDPSRKDGVVYLQDIYEGPGLAGLPRGIVKKLRLFTYNYNFRWMGSHDLVGQESGWDVKNILGTVPVAADGSALFHVPANTPITIQPLDEEGRALQLMRSWMTVRPGETISCIGCHEDATATPLSRRSLGANRSPDEIKPFHGPTRGFAFEREVQPVLDKFCVACHAGKVRGDGRTIPDFANRERLKTRHSQGIFSRSYLALSPYVRRPGPESDYHLLVPMEWHADTSPLVQMLKKGHYNVSLDNEAWEKLYAWIDLNAPFFGTYHETNSWNPGSARSALRRLELQKRYANIEVDPEAVPEGQPQKIEPIKPPKASVQAQRVDPKPNGWPFDEATAKKMQIDAGKEFTRKVPLADGAELNLMLVPAGEFVMGDATGYPDERPRSIVKISKPFWMAEVEISNQLFAQFDPKHDSRYQDSPGKDQTARGYPANQPNQPVVRVSCEQATAFCAWLSQKTGAKFSLPTEAQWEWACRCGSETPQPKLMGRNHTQFGAASSVKASGPNAWGLRDLYDNVSEWTRTAYRPYPYQDDDGRNDPASTESKAVRGGSWEDDATRIRAGIRIPYQPFRVLHNVGFRVVCE